VWTAVNSSLVPYTYRKCKERKFSDISRIVCPILAVFAVVSVMVIMLAPEVVAFLATADYVEAIYVIPPIVAGVFFQVHYFIYANIVYYYKKPRYVMIASISSVVINFVLGYFLIKQFGYIAAGYSTMICYLLQAAIDYFAMRKIVKEEIYDMKIIGGLSLGVIIVAVFSSFIYNFAVVRYSVLLAILILGVMLRKKIFKIFKNIKE
jgi:O-antigen/teichoic acid export membrane protein